MGLKTKLHDNFCLEDFHSMLESMNHPVLTLRFFYLIYDDISYLGLLILHN